MEQWSDQGIVLSARAHGENGAVVTLLTEEHGLHAGYLRGAQSRSKRGVIEPGNLVSVEWRARGVDDLGAYTLEQERNLCSAFMTDPLKFGAMQAACSLCKAALPEREGHAGLFHGLHALLEALAGDFWAVTYILWEVALLKELGFGLDFTQCAGGGSNDDLYYISPRSGRAVSREKGLDYEDKLLLLPDFLKPGEKNVSEEEIHKGLKMTGYFLINWVFAQHTRGVPEERLRFEALFAKTIGHNQQSDSKEGKAQHVAG